jgi:hypothetical protein
MPGYCHRVAPRLGVPSAVGPAYSVLADGHHDVAPDGALEFLRFILQICQFYGLCAFAPFARQKVIFPSKPINNHEPCRVLARFDVFVMPFWGAPGEFALFSHG